MERYLFVIDYQNDFVDGALGFPGAEKLDAGIAAKIRSYGKGRVFFTRDTHFENYLETREGKNLPVVHCIKGSTGWQVYGETAKALAEVEAVAIDKLTFGMNVADPGSGGRPAGKGRRDRAGGPGQQYLRGQQRRGAAKPLPGGHHHRGRQPDRFLR